MSFWPDALAIEVAERRCAVFIGAGASASSKNSDGTQCPPTWPGLIEGLAQKLSVDDNAETLRLMGEGRFLDAAQVAFDALSSADFNLYLKNCLEEPGYLASAIHENVLELDAKIVITTNLDRIYETQFQGGPMREGYSVFRYHDDNLMDGLRSKSRLLLKAHGCVSNPSKAVLTRRQYFTARRQFQGFFAVLDALFLTHTLLFVGCGLEDPDIQLLLENANIAAPATHPHYALVESGRHGALTRAIKETYNIQLLEYPAGDHAVVAGLLGELLAQVESFRATHS